MELIKCYNFAGKHVMSDVMVEDLESVNLLGGEPSLIPKRLMVSGNL